MRLSSAYSYYYNLHVAKYCPGAGRHFDSVELTIYNRSVYRGTLYRRVASMF